MKILQNILLVFAAALFSVALAACGGGGGGGSAGSEILDPGPPPQDTAHLQRVQEAFGETPLALGKAKKGSVIQSTNKDADGVTKSGLSFELIRNTPDEQRAAVAAATFYSYEFPDGWNTAQYRMDYGRYSIRITPDIDGDGTPEWTMGWATHYGSNPLVYGGTGRMSVYFDGSLDSPDASPGAPGSGGGDYLFFYADVTVTTAVPDGFYDPARTCNPFYDTCRFARAHLENVARDLDNGDWFAFGYWMYSPETIWSIYGAPVRVATGHYEIGVFAEGGKLIEHDISSGAGVAEYTGEARAHFFRDRDTAGIYSTTDDLEGRITLRSDFEEQKISGRMILDTDGIWSVDWRLVVDLHEADISEGFFEGDLTLESAGKSYGGCGDAGRRRRCKPDELDLDDFEPIKALQNFTGHWGGNFSHSDGPNDVPDYAVGTFGGKDSESGADIFGTFLTECTQNCDDVAAPAPGFTGAD